MAEIGADWEERFAKYRKKHPGATFAEYYVAQAVAKIQKGRPMASFGPLLRDDAQKGAPLEFEDAGRSGFRRYAALASLAPEHRVVDYGCGSLRLGLHFMLRLAPGNYFGLDVTRDLIEMGENLIGGELLTEKKPRLATIEEGMAKATAFGADVVISNAVSYHVHPVETGAYFANLRSLAGKPGAILVFDVMIADRPVRYNGGGWAWPLEFFVEQLKPLSFVAAHGRRPVTDKRALVAEITGTTLEFRTQTI